MGNTAWQMELFGGLKAHRSGAEMLPLDTRKTTALLACLALRLDQDVPREELAEQLWPGEEWDATRVRLRQSLSILRRALEPAGIPEGSVLSGERGALRLQSTAVWLDVHAMDTALRRAAHATRPSQRTALLQEALAYYQGDLLPGYYEEWVVAARERYAEMMRNLLVELAEAQIASGDSTAARETLRRAIREDPLREDAHFLLIRLYAEAGRAADALRQYQSLERTLLEQMGLAPSRQTRELMARLQQAADTAAHTAPAFRSATVGAARLIPAQIQLETDTSVEAQGGAMPLSSALYMNRPADAAFAKSIARQDSIVLVKGARQIGKTSLLARGLQQARHAGARVVLTDLQKLDAGQLSTPAHLFQTFTQMILDQLDLEVELAEVWSEQRGWNVNFERFLRRHVLKEDALPLVWGLDEADRLFDHDYREVVFGLFRSWHNERSLNPEGPWSRLTLAIAYATEAHLFIMDLNQSPFNVGTRLTLEDFDREQVAELNRRCGTLLRSPEEVNRLCNLVGGHPYLVRRGLEYLAAHRDGGIDQLEQCANRDDGPFGDHLWRLAHSLSQDATLVEAARALGAGLPCPSANTFYRLRSAGVVAGDSTTDARMRCALYQNYLTDRLP